MSLFSIRRIVTANSIYVNTNDIHETSIATEGTQCLGTFTSFCILGSSVASRAAYFMKNLIACGGRSSAPRTTDVAGRI
jgi:hypothetical protein